MATTYSARPNVDDLRPMYFDYSPKITMAHIKRLWPEHTLIGIAVVHLPKSGLWVVPDHHLLRMPAEWLDAAGYASLKSLEHLATAGADMVRLRLQSPEGFYKYPDFYLDELRKPFVWEPGAWLIVDVNQGDREAQVKAVLGEEALIEYTMPKGTTALWIIDRRNKRPGCKRVVSYKRIPKKWLQAIEDDGVDLDANPQRAA